VDAFKGKVAIVTGGASGLGAALCDELGRLGAQAVVADIDGEKAEATAARICAAGNRAEAAAVDVTNFAELRRVLESTAANHGRLDFLFNNAAIFVRREVRDMALEDWRRIVDVNLMGVVAGASFAYAIMAKQGFGHIVNIASISGLTGYPTAAAYAATKAGVVAFSTSLRAEAADLGVRVTVVCPGHVSTGLFRDSATPEAAAQRAAASRPMEAMAAAAAAARILRGAARNEAIIAFPLYAKRLWWLHRLSPGMLAGRARRMVRSFRQQRAP